MRQSGTSRNVSAYSEHKQRTLYPTHIRDMREFKFYQMINIIIQKIKIKPKNRFNKNLAHKYRAEIENGVHKSLD